MASKARARAEARALPYNASRDEQAQAFRVLLTVFKRRCNDYGIMSAYKEHEAFESQPERDRRKRKESMLRRLKEEEIARHGRRPKKEKEKGNGKSKD